MNHTRYAAPVGPPWLHLLAWTLCLACLPAHAAPGDLDPHFGGTGFVLAAPPAGVYTSEGLAIQRDGRVVAAGATFVDPLAPTSRPLLVRYDRNGNPDTGWGGSGQVSPALFGSDYLGAADLTTDAHGKVVMGALGRDHLYVYRFNGDGSPDTSFNGTGMVAIAAGAVFSPVSGITLQSDGRIVMAANALNPATSHTDFVVVRLMPDGTLDATWGGTGIVYTALSSGAGTRDLGRTPIVQPDGKIIVGGRSRSATDYDFALARYMPDGTLDASFGSGGTVTFPMGPGDDYGRRLVLLDDGRIIIAGSVCSLPIATEVCGIGIARLLADGTPDATFGSGGKSITPLGADGGFAFDIAQGSHGTLIVAGTQQFGTAGGTVPATSSVALVARFLPNGTLDATFGSSGFSESSYAHTFASLGDVRIARDGNIYASGIVTEATGVPPDFSALSIARYQN